MEVKKAVGSGYAVSTGLLLLSLAFATGCNEKEKAQGCRRGLELRKVVQQINEQLEYLKEDPSRETKLCAWVQDLGPYLIGQASALKDMGSRLTHGFIIPQGRLELGMNLRALNDQLVLVATDLRLVCSASNQVKMGIMVERTEKALEAASARGEFLLREACSD